MKAKDIVGIIVILALLAWGVVGGVMIWRATDLSCKNLILPCVRIEVVKNTPKAE